MVEIKGFAILTDKNCFLLQEIYDTKKEAEYVAKQTAKDIGDDYKTYKIVKAKIFTI